MACYWLLSDAVIEEGSNSEDKFNLDDLPDLEEFDIDDITEDITPVVSCGPGWPAFVLSRGGR